MFLGTPHGGSADASLGEAFAYLFWFGGLRASASLVSAIKYDSVELGDLHQEFMAVAKDIEIINFYEKRETTSIWGLWRSFVCEPRVRGKSEDLPVHRLLPNSQRRLVVPCRERLAYTQITGA